MLVLIAVCAPVQTCVQIIVNDQMRSWGKSIIFSQKLWEKMLDHFQTSL